MESSSVSVGIVGTGSRAFSLCASLADIEGASMIAACDVVEERAVEMAETFSIESVHTDYETMLEAHAFDAIYVATPPYYMDPIVTAVLERGIHVFVEKPPGVTTEQTERWHEMAMANECRTAVGFQRRFHPLAVIAKKRVDERGGPFSVVATHHKHHGPGSWLLINAVHPLDLLVWLGGSIRAVEAKIGQVAAEAASFDPLAANLYAAMVEYEAGGIGMVHMNNAAGGRTLTFEAQGDGISIYGDIHGSATLDQLVIQTDGEPFSEAETITTDEALAAEPDTPDELSTDMGGYFDPREDGTFQLNQHFIDCVRTDTPTAVPIGAAIPTMRMIDELVDGDRIQPRFAISSN